MEKQTKQRSFHLAYWNAEARIVSPRRVAIEQSLIHLGDVQINELKTLAELTHSHPDVLLIDAGSIPSDRFSSWLERISQEIGRDAGIWMPAVFFADVTYTDLAAMLPKAAMMNWYFDVVSSREIESLPIRVANLIRIHDHLGELKRYSDALSDLQKQVTTLDGEIAKLRAPT